MKINHLDKNRFKHIDYLTYYLFFLISAFILIACYFFFTWPIVGLDTDLWYHLNGGRYFWQTQSISKDAFFSYIIPSKTTYNYYWMFQAIIYGIFQWTNYYGLVVLRGLLYVLTVFFIFLLILPVRKEFNLRLLTGVLLSVICSLIILYREILIRPHLFSYLFIVIFLYIIEIRRDKIWMLPFLGIVWSNIHGIEFPVMFLIVFAYLAETFYHHFRKTNQALILNKTSKWLLISVFYTIFITPQFIELVQLPFNVSFQESSFQHLYVAELRKLMLAGFFVFAPVTVSGFIATLQNLVIYFVAGVSVISLYKKQMRISHTILLVGALILLYQHSRFTYEFTLLCIPLMKNGLDMLPSLKMPSKAIHISMPIIVIGIPFFIFFQVFNFKPSFPLAHTNLPEGNVRFLNHVQASGRLLNEPNTGGYLQWALDKDVKIYMDMQLSIFNDIDFAFVNNSLAGENTFREFIQKYDPSFISVSVHRTRFKEIAAQNHQFVPVFFDQSEVLCVNKNHREDLANQYELKTIDPFKYHDAKYEEMSQEILLKQFAEASRIHALDKMNYGANYVMCQVLLVQKKYDAAIFYSDNIIRYYPDLPAGYALKADARFGQHRYQEAKTLYQQALDMGQTDKASNIYHNLFATYVKLNEHKKAYKLFSEYVNPFNERSDYKDIYHLAMAAASIGKEREALTFLKIAKMKVPADDKEYVGKINDGIAIYKKN